MLGRKKHLNWGGGKGIKVFAAKKSRIVLEKNRKSLIRNCMHFKVVKKNHHQRRVRFNKEASLVSSLGLWKKPFKAMGGDRSGTRLVKKRRQRLIWRPQSTNREAKKVFQQTFFFLEPPTRFCGGMWNGWVSIFSFSALLLWNFLIFSPKCKLEFCTFFSMAQPPVTFYLYTIRSLFASRRHYFTMPWEHLSLRMQKVAPIYVLGFVSESVRTWTSACMHVWAQPPMHFYQADTCDRQRWPYIPAAGWHCASTESQLHSIHSALVFTLFAHKARWMVVVTTQDCPLHLQNMFGRALQSVTVIHNIWQQNCQKLLLNPIRKDNFMHFSLHLFSCYFFCGFAPFFLFSLPALFISLISRLIQDKEKTKELSEQASSQNPHPSPSLTSTQQGLYSRRGW